MVEFIKVSTPRDIESLAGMADKIWHECYASILDAGQIDYMLDRFQSTHAIEEQILSDNYEYYFLTVDNMRVGYLGLQFNVDELFLSKLYILPAERHKGYATEAFDYCEEVCRQRGLSRLRLTVNRHNSRAIDRYIKYGYTVVREQVSDIGSGYVMDDYVMGKNFE